jgi:periplasmic protein TonB
MALAVLFSAALHVFLIFGFSWQPPAGGLPRLSLLHARLARQEPWAGTREPPLQRLPDMKQRGQENGLPPRPVVEPLPPPGPEPPGISALPAVSLAPVEASLRTPVPQEVRPPAPERAVALADLAFHAAGDLDVYPAPLSPIVPSYPQDAKAAGLAGSVRLMVMLDEFGHVTEATILETRPEGLFDAAAIEAYRGALFSPAAINGRPVRSRLVIQVDFDAADD